MGAGELERRYWLGILALFLALLGLGGVLAFRYPELLTTREIRNAIPLPYLRGLLQVVMIGGVAAGVLGLLLRRGKRLSAIALAILGMAWLLGGWQVPGRAVGEVSGLGVDWLLLSIFALVIIFVPLERAFGARQAVLRGGWTVDLMHYTVSHLLVNAIVLLSLWPAHTLFVWARMAPMQEAIAGAPLWLAIPLAILVADFAQYWIHRWMHRNPVLWRFHAIHHSSNHMDWLAGSRLHIGDILAVRAFTFVPLFLMGFSQAALAGYVAFVSLHAVFIHANVRIRVGPVEHVLVTPRFHHWHHAVSPIDKNFAVHVPWLDTVFGTRHFPSTWPSAYGIQGDPVPNRYAAQLLYPLRRRSPPSAPQAREGIARPPEEGPTSRSPPDSPRPPPA